MKVQGPNRPTRPYEAGRVENGRSVSNGSRDAAAKPVEGERVALSSEVKQIFSARQPETPDAALVKRLRDAIAKGAFRVDPDRIAELLLAEESK